MRGLTIAAITAAAVLCLPATARAGEAVKLAVEFPPDVRHVTPGATLDLVQVVGIDADGRRVGFGGKSAVLTVTGGTAKLVEAPFRFAYTAPATIAGPSTVTFTAQLEGAPSIRGSAELAIVPKGPYVRLGVRAEKPNVAWGGSTLVTVEGEKRNGRLVPVVKGKVELRVEGPGTVEFVRLGTYQFTAPDAPARERSAVLIAEIDGNPAVHGRTSIALGSRDVEMPPPVGPPLPEPPAERDTAERDTAKRDTVEPRPTEREDAPATKDDPPAGKPSSEKPSSEKPSSEKPSVGSDEEPSGDPAASEPKDDTSAQAPDGGKRAKGRGSKKTDDGAAGSSATVPWPGGAVEVVAWRGRADRKKDTRLRRIKKLPEPGGEFASRDVEQRIRAIVTAEGVTDVTAEWRIADGEPLADDVPGKVRTTRGRRDQLVAVIDAAPPAQGGPLRVTLTLHRAEGDLRAEFVLRRARKAPTGAADGKNPDEVTGADKRKNEKRPKKDE